MEALGLGVGVGVAVDFGVGVLDDLHAAMLNARTTRADNRNRLGMGAGFRRPTWLSLLSCGRVYGQHDFAVDASRLALRKCGLCFCEAVLAGDHHSQPLLVHELG